MSVLDTSSAVLYYNVYQLNTSTLPKEEVSREKLILVPRKKPIPVYVERSSSKLEVDLSY
jgi:hypothetical protein